MSSAAHSRAAAENGPNSDSPATASPATVSPATVSPLPIIDIAPYLAGDPGAKRRLADELRDAEENVGFYILAGHGVPRALVDDVFAQTAAFHALPPEPKLALRANAHNVGYMPYKSSVSRASRVYEGERKANMVAAYFLKRDLPADHPDIQAGIRFRCQNQWPDAGLLPDFRRVTTAYLAALEALSLKLLPLYALALELPEDFFADAFSDPMMTLRLSHYPVSDTPEDNQFGLAPHTDSSFMTLLAQNQVPGLEIRLPSGEWHQIPAIPDSFVVNSGDMLHRWTNERFRSTPHRAINTAGVDRYAIPFFFDCRWDYRMECLPSCTGPGNPPKYEPMTYMDYMLWFTGQNYDHVREHKQ